MGGGHANIRMESQHHSVQSNKLHTIPVNVWGRGSATRGDKTETPMCPNEAEEKDLLELDDRLKAVTNIQKYQDEIRTWTDVGNLVLLRSPRTKNIGKFETKWAGPYVVIDKMRPDAYHLSDTQGRALEHS
jgi:hypothetical protein